MACVISALQFLEQQLKLSWVAMRCATVATKVRQRRSALKFDWPRLIRACVWGAA